MKSAQISEYGDPSIIKINEVEKPSAGEGQVLVEVHSASLNPFDSAVRAGYMKEVLPLQFPATLGGDIAGVVVELGDGVDSLALDDKVYGQASVVAGNSGAFAEYAVTKVGQIAKVPDGLDFTTLASLPLVGVSALQALGQHINIRSDQKLFIHGGAGAIGSIALQIAKSIGAYVTTTATGDGIEYVKKLGADEVIDYKTQDFSKILKDYDAVFDTVGGDDFNKSLKVLKKGGIAVSMIAQADKKLAQELGVTAQTQATHVTTEALDKLRGLVNSGVVKPNVGKVFPLEQVKDAFIARESGKVSGKIVLQIK